MKIWKFGNFGLRFQNNEKNSGPILNPSHKKKICNQNLMSATFCL